MNKPLVSIIMGVYNAETTINSCIESVLAQTYDNWELIVCDDASKDNSWAVLQEYQNKDSRIICLRNETNMRLAASLNNCLAIAKGKYVARLDADDECLPERLERQVEFLERHNEYAVVGCARIIFDEHGERGIRYTYEYPNKDVLLRDTPYAHPTIMMRKSVYEALGGYISSRETMRAEDLDLWIRFYEAGYQGYNMQEPLYRYRESLEDYRKRTLKAAIETAKVFWMGYKKLKFSYYQRIWVIKPIITALVPDSIMRMYHKDN